MGNNTSLTSLSQTAPPLKHLKPPKNSSSDTVNPSNLPIEPPKTIQQNVNPPNPSKEVFVCQKVVDFQQDFLKRFRLNHPNLLKTLGFDLNVNYFASGNFPMGDFIYFEYAPKSIKQLLVDRKPNKLLSDYDMRAFFRDMINVLSFFQENDISHGDLDSSTIFFDEVHEIFKIYDQELLSGSNSGFVLTKEQKKSSLLAPELMIAFIYQPNLLYLEGNYFKADVFSLGMMFLEVGCLRDSLEIYDYKNVSINKQLLNERLVFMSQYYSIEVIQVLTLMLEFDEKKRPDFLQLRNILLQENIKGNNANINQNYSNNELYELPPPYYERPQEPEFQQNQMNVPKQKPEEIVYQQQYVARQKDEQLVYQQHAFADEQNQMCVRKKAEESSYQQQDYYNQKSQYPPFFENNLNEQAKIEELAYQKQIYYYNNNEKQQLQPQVARQRKHKEEENNYKNIDKTQLQEIYVPAQYEQKVMKQQRAENQIPQPQKIYYTQQQLPNQAHPQPQPQRQIAPEQLKSPQKMIKNYYEMNKNPQTNNMMRVEEYAYGELKRVDPNERTTFQVHLVPNQEIKENQRSIQIQPEIIPQQVMKQRTNEMNLYDNPEQFQSNVYNAVPNPPQIRYIEPNYNTQGIASFGFKDQTVKNLAGVAFPYKNVKEAENEKNNQFSAQKENYNNDGKIEDFETKESLERLRLEIMNSKKIIENYEKNKKGTEKLTRKPFNEMASYVNKEESIKEKSGQKANKTNLNTIKNAHKNIIDRNRKLDERLEEVLRKSQAITKNLK